MSRKSSVMVEVRDTSPYVYTARKKVQEIGIVDLKGMADDGPWGTVKTPKGIYCLNRLGQGNLLPIDDMISVFHLKVYPFFEEGFGTTESFAYAISLKELISLDIIRSQNLADFIYNYGPKVELTYQYWNKLLSRELNSSAENDLNDDNEYIDDNDSNAGPEGYELEKEPERDLGIIIAEKKDLIKYAPFIRKTSCENMRKCGALFTAVNGICSCGQLIKHTHCKNCGGIIS